jgi:ABC-type glycerol-3-phosphate transport system substrate-binding protein
MATHAPRPISRRALLRGSGLALAGAASAVLLAACGGSGTPAAPAAAPAKPAESKPAEAAKPTQAAAAAAPAKPAATAPGEITFWTMETTEDPTRKMLTDAAEKFSKEKNIKVNVEFVTWGDAYSKYLATFEANTPPDAGQHSPITPVTFKVANRTADVTDLVKELGQDDFYDAVQKDVQRDGKFYGVPWFSEIRVLMYWKDLVEKANVNPNFKTWDEWLTGLKATTQGEQYGLAMRGFKGWGQFSQSLAVANGGGSIDKDGKTILNTKETVEAVTWWTDLYLKHKVTPPGTPQHTQPDAQQLFVKRQVAFLWDNVTPALMAGRDDPSLLEKFGVAFIPGPVAGKPGWHFLGGSRLMVFQGKNESQSREWVKFLQSKEQLLALFKTNPIYVPARKSLVSDPMFNDTEWRKNYIKAQETATYYSSIVAGALPEIQAAEAQRIYANIDEAVLGGTASPQAACDVAQKQMEELRAQLKV